MGQQPAAEAIKTALQQTLAIEDDPRMKGACGLYTETRRRHENDRTLIRVRDIATSFGLRFLAMYYQTYYRT